MPFLRVGSKLEILFGDLTLKQMSLMRSALGVEDLTKQQVRDLLLNPAREPELSPRHILLTDDSSWLVMSPDHCKAASLDGPGDGHISLCVAGFHDSRVFTCAWQSFDIEDLCNKGTVSRFVLPQSRLRALRCTARAAPLHCIAPRLTQTIALPCYLRAK